MSQLDLSVKVIISLEIFKIVFRQETFVSFFDMLNNNVIFEDVYSEHFKNSLITQADSVDRKTYVPPYRENQHDKKVALVSV